MNIIIRVVSIGILTILVSSIPWLFDGMEFVVVVLQLIFPVSVINGTIFMLVAGVRMSIRRARRQVGDRPGSYSDRFKSHLFTWSVLTVFAWLTVWGFLAWLASGLEVSGASNAPFALLMVVPTFILGVIASAIVERIYETILTKRSYRA